MINSKRGEASRVPTARAGGSEDLSQCWQDVGRYPGRQAIKELKVRKPDWEHNLSEAKRELQTFLASMFGPYEKFENFLFLRGWRTEMLVETRSTRLEEFHILCVQDEVTSPGRQTAFHA